jgi:hypothetical protein
MTLEEFEKKFDNNEYDDAYATYIMDNCAGDRMIGSGDMLITAIEEGYLYERFCDSIIDAA